MTRDEQPAVLDCPSLGPSARGHGALSIRAAVPTITTSRELGGITWVLKSGSGGARNGATGTVCPGGSAGLH